MLFNEIIDNKPVMKMHGCGNDFVVMFDNNDLLNFEFVKKICTLHYGVGSDGLIAVMKSRLESCMYRMKFYNPDGTTAQMCGNGIRCFTKYLADLNLIPLNEEVHFDTDAGIIKCSVLENDNQNAIIKVNMGIPVFYNPDQITLIPDKTGIIRGKIKNQYFTFVSMGNPHAVIFSENPAADVKKYGPLIEKNINFFPEKINVEFVRVNSKNDLTMYVWERGAGETLACGTGACASFVASRLNSMTEDKGIVHLLGGDLTIEWAGSNNSVYMTGNAINVFEINPASIGKYFFK